MIRPGALLPMPNVYIPSVTDTPEAILRHIYALDSDVVESAGLISVTFSGNAFTALPSQPCKQVTILNLTGVTLSFQRDGAGETIEIPDGVSWMFRGLKDASDLRVRRFDQSGTQVTFKAEWEA